MSKRTASTVTDWGDIFSEWFYGERENGVEEWKDNDNERSIKKGAGDERELMGATAKTRRASRPPALPAVPPVPRDPTVQQTQCIHATHAR